MEGQPGSRKSPSGVAPTRTVLVPNKQAGKPQPNFMLDASRRKQKAVEEKKKQMEKRPEDVEISELDLRKNLNKLRSIKPGVIQAILFKISTPEEIIGHDNCQVTEPNITAVNNCILDPRMGATREQNCQKCGRNSKECPGHYGYVKLEWPILNPVFLPSIIKIMRLFCFNHWKLSDRLRRNEIAKRTLAKDLYEDFDVNSNNLDAISKLKKEKDAAREAATQLADEKGMKVEIVPCFDPERPNRDWPDIGGTWRLQLIEATRECKKCVANKQPVFYSVKRDWYIYERIGEKGKGHEIPVDPRDIKAFFEAIDNDTNEKGENRNWAQILGFGSNKLSAMIMTHLPVLPNTFRLAIKTPNQTLDNPLSIAYHHIVAANKQLGNILLHKGTSKDIQEDLPSRGTGVTFDIMLSSVSQDGKVKGGKAYDDLNQYIKNLIYAKDDSHNETYDNEKRVGGQVMSITLTLNGKQGILRKDVMGKGSDHSGRAVIIGDTNIFIDEVGVPASYTKTLTIPEALETEEDVVKWNKEMPKIVNGKKVMGLVMKVIKNVRGRSQVFHTSRDQVITLEVGDVIRRQLTDGDIVVMSRQPVLHKGGLMGFKAKIFHDGGNVFRLHQSVVGPFNGDFDGDEMNMSVPQNLRVRQEVASRMMVTNCIKGDKYSTPWIGLIQNPILAGVEISRPGVIVEESLRLRVINVGLNIFRKRNAGGLFRTDVNDYFDQLYSLERNLDPSSGRALVSFFMPKDFNYESRRRGKEPVIVENGFLVSGVLEKADIGKASNGMIDAILSRYGAEAVVVFLSALTSGLYEYISATGYSLGIRDCTLQRLPDGTDPQETIDKLVQETSKEVIAILSESSSQVGYLAKLAEAKADKLLASLGDRIGAIVKAGGIDTVGLKNRLNAEKKDETLQEIMAEASKLDIEITPDKVPFVDLIDLGVIQPTQESVKAQIENVRNIMSLGKRPRNEQLSYLQEIDTLNIVLRTYAKVGDLRTIKFKNVQLAMISNRSDLLQKIKRKLEEAIKIRSDLVGSSKFSNRLLTVVYSGAKGTVSNLIQALGSIGPQEKSYIGRNETTGRSLPIYKENELDPVATHFCASSFAKGMSPEENWNHASATRANITESNLKPAVTGFFYRRVWILAGDLYSDSDGSVRDERGRIVQYMYGGDGFDATRLFNVNKNLPPQFISIGSEAKNIRAREGLTEYEYKL